MIYVCVMLCDLHTPYTVTDLNLISWSSNNLLAVALGPRLFVWNATSGDITQLMEIDDEQYISSASWVKEGNFLALGLSSGEIQVGHVSYSFYFSSYYFYCVASTSLQAVVKIFL